MVSGCDWGNILVWDEDLVDVQVTRKGRNPCHLAPIIEFLYSVPDAELTSVSMDGTIKFWYYRTVNAANPADDNDRVIEMEPSFTIDVRDAVGVSKIMGLSKINNDPRSNDYFIQVTLSRSSTSSSRVFRDISDSPRFRNNHRKIP